MWDKIAIIITLCILSVTYFSKKVFYFKLNKIKYNFYFFAFYFMCILMGCVLWPYFLLKPRNVKNLKTAASIIRHVTKLYELKWELRNGKIFSEVKGAIVVSNHQSSLDVLGLFNIWEVIDNLTIIAKKELFYIFPFGLTAWLGGIVFIDRNNPKSAYNQLSVASNIMTKNNTKIWLFPEGTRNKDRSKLLPFKKGAFNIAIASQVPIIPVVYSPYYFTNKKKGYFLNKGRIVIQCLEPIPTKGLRANDTMELMNRVRDTMETTYKALSKEVLDSLPPDYPSSMQQNML